MSINRPIDNDRSKGISGSDFANEMDYLAAEGVKSVIIDINSVGGSVVEGFSIFSSIKDAPFHTTTRVVGIAASMAGVISQAADKRIIMDYGIFHAHGPQVPKGKKVEATMVSTMLDSLKTMIGAKCNLSREQIDEIMSKESVFTAVEALQMGFFDEIEKTKGNSPVLLETADVNDLYEVANQFINKNDEMKKLNAFLGLENATEDVIVNAVTDIKAKADKVEALTNEIETLTNSVTAKDAQIETLTNEIKASKALNAETIVNAAVEAGKISEESKAAWIEQATNSFEVTKKLIDGLMVQKTALKVVDKLKADKDPEDRKTWDYKTWGEKDPKGLAEMQNSAPEKFEKLFTDYTNN